MADAPSWGDQAPASPRPTGPPQFTVEHRRPRWPFAVVAVALVALGIGAGVWLGHGSTSPKAIAVRATTTSSTSTTSTVPPTTTTTVPTPKTPPPTAPVATVIVTVPPKIVYVTPPTAAAPSRIIGQFKGGDGPNLPLGPITTTGPWRVVYSWHNNSGGTGCTLTGSPSTDTPPTRRYLDSFTGAGTTGQGSQSYSDVGRFYISMEGSCAGGASSLNPLFWSVTVYG